MLEKFSRIAVVQYVTCCILNYDFGHKLYDSILILSYDVQKCIKRKRF